MKNLSNTDSGYNALLQKILQNLQKTSEKITRQKVEMAWNIGKLVEKFLAGNRDENYGKNLILRLEKDSGISQNYLYKMRTFAQAYPKLPKDDPKLNYSHYRILASISDKDERKYLEDLTRENEWGANFLQKKVSEIKGKKSQKLNQRPKAKILKTTQKLTVTRGSLFTYKVAEFVGEKFLDLGFNIFERLEVLAKFNEGDVLESVKNEPRPKDAVTTLEDGVYSFKKSPTPKSQLHTYKAYLEKVVDGDTINVILDLGFNIFHKEILRLAKINAPEKTTKEGIAATTKLKEILKNTKSLVIKTNKTDIYGRYIADVFLENEQGEYLNQMLLDCGVVEFVKY